MNSPLDPGSIDTATVHADRSCQYRKQRPQFRSQVRALWRKVNGLPDEPAEALADGMALTEAPVGQPLQVRQILGGCQRLRRLIEMGVYPRARLEVVRSSDHGPVIIKVGESRLAIGRNIARSIVVDLPSQA